MRGREGLNLGFGLYFSEFGSQLAHVMTLLAQTDRNAAPFPFSQSIVLRKLDFIHEDCILNISKGTHGLGSQHLLSLYTEKSVLEDSD